MRVDLRRAVHHVFTALLRPMLDADVDDIAVLRALPSPSSSCQVTVYVNAPPSWPVTWTQTVPFATSLPFFGDINGDGVTDACWTSGTGNQPNVEVALGLGNGVFSNATLFSSWMSPGVACQARGVADIDGDGLFDILVAPPWSTVPYAGQANLGILYGSAIQTVDPVAVIPNALQYLREVIPTDFDLDGVSDLLIIQDTYNVTYVDPGEAIWLLRGLGNRVWSSAPVLIGSLSAPYGGLRHVVKDLDLDGDSDIVGVGWPDRLSALWRNEVVRSPGCSGTQGIPQIVVGSPTIGNAGFSIALNGAAAGASAVLGVSTGWSASTGCAVGISLSPGQLLLPNGGLGLAVTDQSGGCTISIPIPQVPALAGFAVYAQWGVVDPAGGLVIGTASFALSPSRSIMLF